MAALEPVEPVAALGGIPVFLTVAPDTLSLRCCKLAELPLARGPPQNFLRLSTALSVALASSELAQLLLAR